MAGQRTLHIFKPIAGAALAGIGMFILYLHLTAAVDGLRHILGAGSSAALALLVAIPSVSQASQAYAADHHRFLQRALVSCWPLLLVVVGTVLARGSFTDHATALSSKKYAGRVDLQSSQSTSK
jgi:hypothetical protein